MPLNTLLDAQRTRSNDVEVGVIQENLAGAPELGVFPIRQIAGTSYRTLVVSGQNGGGFRSANQGVALGKTTYEQRLHECFLYEHDIEIDLAVQLATVGDSIADIETIEMQQASLTLMQKMGRQIFYGTAFDAGGFSGLKQFVPKTAVAGSSAFFVDATGSTASTASSIYAVRMGLQDVHVVLGGGTALNFGAFMDQQLTDAAGRKFMGRVAALTAWAGLQIGSVESVGRIGNLTAQTGKGATDALLAQLTALFRAGRPPQAFFMSRRSAFQLASARPRTAYFTPGAVRAGSTVAVTDYTVSDYQGIPIIVTDQILDTDAIE